MVNKEDAINHLRGVIKILEKEDFQWEDGSISMTTPSEQTHDSYTGMIKNVPSGNLHISISINVWSKKERQKRNSIIG